MKIIKEYIVIIILAIIVIALTVLNIILLNKKVTCKKTIKTDNYTLVYKNLIGFNNENNIVELTSDIKEIQNKETSLLKKENYKIDLENNKITAKKTIKIKNRKNEIIKYKKDGFKCN